MLSEEEVIRFRAAGYHFPSRVMDAGTAESYRVRIDEFLAARGGLERAERLIRFKGHLRCPALLELIHHPRILDAVEDVLGPDLLCWGSSVFYKPARDPRFVSWHQDMYYWGLDPADGVTAWLALTDATAENGALQVLSHSHHGRMMAHRDLPAPDNMLERGQQIAEPIDPARTITLALAAGEISVHHVKLAHGSTPNRSDRPRIGYAIRYLAPHVRPANVENDGVIRVRGVDRFRNFAEDRLQHCPAIA